MSISVCTSAATGSEIEEVRDSVRIYFQAGKGSYDPTLDNNEAVLNRYIEYIRTLESQGRLCEVEVKGYVSPEGAARVNRRLAARRSRVIADIIMRQAGIDSSKIRTLSGGVNWDELRNLIATEPDVPARDELLNIIDNTPTWTFDRQGNIIGGRRKSLMDLRGGRPYRWIYTHLFPRMRHAAVISLAYKQLPPPYC